VVYAKRPFGGPGAVLKYLARYTHRVAISNRRLLGLEGGRVRFRYKDYARGGKRRVMELGASEFLRRFVQHVLPRGFVRVRYYGLLSHRGRREDLERCRALLGAAAAEQAGPADATVAPVAGGPGGAEVAPPRRCPECGSGRMVVVAELPPQPRSRGGVTRPSLSPAFDTS
jgi:hypothetical protein